MVRFLRNILILILPLLLMVLVNEFSRNPEKESPHKSYGMETINSGVRMEEKCTWVCHNETGYCKSHHVKFDSGYYQFTDPLYFGMIAGLRAFGNYGLANIFLLVLFFPMLLYTLLIKSLHIQDKINQLKKS